MWCLLPRVLHAVLFCIMHEFLIIGIVRDDWLDFGRRGKIRMLRPFQIILEVLLEKARVNL